jgi:hypothetical protein
MTLVNTPLVVDNINACPVQTDYQYIVLFYAPNIEEQFFIQFWSLVESLQRSFN